MTKLSCPLCFTPHFDNVHVLRTSLISVATSEISCPVCQESLKGLDKLTIHLFSHLIETPPPQVNTELPPMLVDEVPTLSVDVESAPILVDAPSPTPEPDNSGPDNSSIATSSEAVAVGLGIEQEITNAQLVIANETRTIRCDICNFTFSDENILDMHQKLLHQTLVDEQTGLCSYHCHLCSKKFKMKGSLMVHLRVAHYGFGHNRGDNDLAENLQKLKQAAAANSAEGGKKWACDVCKKLFTTKYFLKKHKRLHTGEMPYFCVECNKYFTFQQSYRKHMLYHSSEKPHVCTVCGRAFKELSTLHNHERIHSGERPFACETCGKCFRQRVSYLVHKRIHTGVMPYQCLACGKTFRYKVSQRSHKCTATSPSPGPTASAISQNGAEGQESQPDPVNPGICDKKANIVFNVNGEIVSQNFTFDGETLITYSTNLPPLNEKPISDSDIQNQVQIDKNLENISILNSDFLSMALSPIPLIPSNEPIESNKTQLIPIQVKHLQTINEESFKQLLYGPNK